jgi:hypothetical protein
MTTALDIEAKYINKKGGEITSATFQGLIFRTKWYFTLMCSYIDSLNIYTRL